MKPYWRVFFVLVFSFVLIGNLSAQTNLLTNPGFEIREPAFWIPLNDGLNGSQCTWEQETAQDTAYAGQYYYKVVKPNTTANAVGWVPTVNNATNYWNRANGPDGDNKTWDLSFYARTEGVNINPTTDDEKIGVVFKFYEDGVWLSTTFVEVDQTVANKSWEKLSGLLIEPGNPDSIQIEMQMGKDATGTVSFDNINCNVTPGWAMGVFNGSAETPLGWLNWSDGSGFNNVVEDTVHDGLYSILLEENDGDADERVYYTGPVPVTEGNWYKIGAWVKTEGISTDTLMYQTTPVAFRDDARLGFCFFFHKAPLVSAWDLIDPGDLFWYIDQRTGKENEDWTHYSVIWKAPEFAAGVSIRARFTSYPTGKVWYDDFLIREVTAVITAIDDPTDQITLGPTDYKLYNNYPNPFNPQTIIEYMVPKTGRVVLAIYNVLGQKVRTLVDVDQIKGTYNVMWDGKDNFGNKLSTGIYFYQLRGENALITKKMTFIK